MNKLVHAACPHDCPDACGVLITVEDGRATKIQGDPAHPVTRGFLCAKVAKYLDRVYSPQRVLWPLKRVGPKVVGNGALGKRGSRTEGGVGDGRTGPAGEGAGVTTAGATTGFVRITWDEALDEIAARFRRISDEFGPEAILPYSYGGTLGALGNASMDRRFFHRLGASQLDRTICAEAGGDGLKSVIGHKFGTEPEQFAESRYIIAWGANIHGNNIHLWPFIEEARHKGAKLVVIDPYRTRTAKSADWYLPINPGTDVALALGMMHVIISEHLYDESYVLNYTFGFEQLRERVREYAPETVAQWTGISAEDIRRLAREYATMRPAAIRVNYGLQRSENGGMAMRAITMLPCLTGSWKEVGGGLQLSVSGAFKFDKEGLERPDLMMKSPVGRATRMVNMTELGKALDAEFEPPVKALFVYNSNPAAVAPEHNRVVRGMAREDLFTVVHDQFMTDTCDYANIVLPATTFFEHTDLVPSYGHYYVQKSQQAIDALGECKSNMEIFRLLAARMGFEEACFRETEDEMIDVALASGHEFLAGIDRARLEREPHVRLNVPAGGSSAGGLGSGGYLDVGESEDVGENDDVGVGEYVGENENVGVGENRARRRGHRRYNGESGEKHWFLPFAEGNFGTASGKAEFYSENLVALGLDPVVSFTPPTESRHTEGGAYPLEMLPRKADNYVNSTFANLESHQRLERAAKGSELSGSSQKSESGTLLTTDVLEMNVADAKFRGISNGDSVRVFNDRGEIRLIAQVNGSVQPGVVAARLGWAKLSAGGKNINVLTSDRLTDMGRAATFYSVLVEVEKAG